MAILKRHRLIYWLIVAYIKRWGEIIFFSFVSGLIIFFLLLNFSKYLFRFIFIQRKATIGLVGEYQIDTLPPLILDKLSQGLTHVEPNGSIKPALADSWEVKDSGKKYIFHLDKNKYFSNGKHVTADLINYHFTDAAVDRPDQYTLIYTLKDSFSPFLATVSRPIFYKGLIGAGEWKIATIDIKSKYVKSLRLSAVNNKFKTEEYEFYPTPDALKIAFTMGEVTQAIGVSDISIKNSTFASFPNVTVEKKPDYAELVTLFFNTQDNVLSDKKARSGLAYALPDEFSEGQRVYVPYSPESMYFNDAVNPKKFDLEQAQVLTESITSSSTSATLTLTTLPKYRPVADEIAQNWNKIGIKTTIVEVDTIPAKFQMYLGDFMLPKDPDQYSLWHSDQPYNITRYKNLRIDKLLEDGRKITDINARKKIYADFQKYLLEDTPAAFLYFPYQYVLTRN